LICPDFTRKQNKISANWKIMVDSATITPINLFDYLLQKVTQINEGVKSQRFMSR
jgi:hypothetical protein